MRKVVHAALVVAAGVVTWRVIVRTADDRDNWMNVARDSGYTVSIDTTHIMREYGRTYEVWYRTDHAMTRFYKQKAFTREMVHAILRCDNYSFRVMSSAMSMGSRYPVVQQATEPKDLADQPWRPVEAGSTEADAARGACIVSDWTASARR
jgi:hypothetical protein